MLDGLVRGVESSAQSAQLDMDDALKDLDALMVKAREMVRLAGELNDRLTTVSELNASSGGAEPDTATFIRSSLAQLGLRMADVPVTLDMARDEKRWYEQLARELAAVLQGTGGKSGAGMMGDRGIIPLDEVWGGWNRVRGVGEASYVLLYALRRVLKNVRIRSSLDSLAIFASTTPSTSVYGPNDHGSYIPRQWPARATHAHLHTGRLRCASSWDVTHIGCSHYVGNCARGRRSYWACF
jgi:hypothetical protein